MKVSSTSSIGIYEYENPCIIKSVGESCRGLSPTIKGLECELPLVQGFEFKL